MSKRIVLSLLAAMALAGTTDHAVAMSVPQGFAHGFCQGQWVHNMDTHTSICAYCQVSATTGRPTGKPRCDFFVCDESGSCEWQVVERRSPKGRWLNVRPSASQVRSSGAVLTR